MTKKHELLGEKKAKLSINYQFDEYFQGEGVSTIQCAHFLDA